MEHDKKWMQRCLDLAKQGIKGAFPNPLVGSVIVREGEVVGEGAHLRFGGPHAELNAISSVAETAKLAGATLYVNLEPCSHWGKTPPCVQAIIKSGIKRVVIGALDPTHAGGGAELLREAGIKVTTGVLNEECQVHNYRFFTYSAEQRPWIVLKWAMTADEFMAPESRERLQISCEESRKLSHLWRAEEAAILVGAQTVLTDDPELTVREVTGENPVRLVIDPDLRTAGERRIYRSDAPTWVFNCLKEEEAGTVSYLKLPKSEAFLPMLLLRLWEKGILSVIVEGGRATLDSFIEAGFWDEVRVFNAPLSFGRGLAAPDIPTSAVLVERSQSGADILAIYRPLPEWL